MRGRFSHMRKENKCFFFAYCFGFSLGELPSVAAAPPTSSKAHFIFFLCRLTDVSPIVNLLPWRNILRGKTKEGFVSGRQCPPTKQSKKICDSEYSLRMHKEGFPLHCGNVRNNPLCMLIMRGRAWCWLFFLPPPKMPDFDTGITWLVWNAYVHFCPEEAPSPFPN